MGQHAHGVVRVKDVEIALPAPTLSAGLLLKSMHIGQRVILLDGEMTPRICRLFVVPVVSRVPH